MAEHATVVRIIRFQPTAGKRDELIAALKAGAEQIRELEGCFGVQVASVHEAPDQVASISRWASQAALDAFVQATTSQRGTLDALTAAPPTTEHYASL